MKCKKCGKVFHYCTSCDCIPSCSQGFCSDECWEESNEYKNEKEKFLKFYKSLNSEQKEYFIYLTYGLDSDYTDLIEEYWLAKIGEGENSNENIKPN